MTITVRDDELVIKRAASIFGYRIPQSFARTQSDAAEERAWADAAGRDPVNRRSDAA